MWKLILSIGLIGHMVLMAGAWHGIKGNCYRETNSGWQLTENVSLFFKDSTGTLRTGNSNTYPPKTQFYAKDYSGSNPKADVKIYPQTWRWWGKCSDGNLTYKSKTYGPFTYTGSNYHFEDMYLKKQFGYGAGK